MEGRKWLLDPAVAFHRAAGRLMLHREIEFYFKVCDTNDDVGRC